MEGNQPESLTGTPGSSLSMRPCSTVLGFAVPEQGWPENKTFTVQVLSVEVFLPWASVSSAIKLGNQPFILSGSF